MCVGGDAFALFRGWRDHFHMHVSFTMCIMMKAHLFTLFHNVPIHGNSLYFSSCRIYPNVPRCT